MSRTSIPLITSLALLSVACGDPSGPPAPVPIAELPRSLSAAEVRVIAGVNAFSFDLLREVRAAEPGAPNTFLSPLSASMALGMTMNGAAGDTWTQMRDALGFHGMEESEINEAYRDLIGLLLALDPSVETALGNSIWTSDRLPPLLPEFTAAARAFFDAEARALDFSDPAAVDDINAWVADVTNGRIDRLLDRIPDGALLYLINAVYFNADWRSRFDPSETHAAPFVKADGSTTSVPMMRGRVGHLTLSSATARGVELPYGGGAFTAVALLPPAGQGIDEFVATIDALTWEAWMGAFDAASAREDLERAGRTVLLPKFELRWKGGLKPPLRALGMVDAFDERADLSRLFGEGGLVITRVLQKSFVRVDEAGTEAAAATAVEVSVTSVGPQVFAFDRPFLFAIRERLSGTILFLGVIGDPSAS